MSRQEGDFTVPVIFAVLPPKKYIGAILCQLSDYGSLDLLRFDVGILSIKFFALKKHLIFFAISYILTNNWCDNRIFDADFMKLIPLYFWYFMKVESKTITRLHMASGFKKRFTRRRNSSITIDARNIHEAMYLDCAESGCVLGDNISDDVANTGKLGNLPM